MKNVNSCVICGSKNTTEHAAQCSPFLAERIWDSKPFDVKLVHCNTCDFSFYNPRPDDEELGKLYKNYRDSYYQEQRQKYEKGYTKEINESLGHGKTEIVQRKKDMSLFLKDRFDFSGIKNILDYGGDNGQFIIDEFNESEKYVYDISGVPLNSGINRRE